MRGPPEPIPHGHAPQDGDGEYRLSLVIPAWNEEATIGLALREAIEALRRVTTQYEVLVVDDGSSDGTAEIVREFAKTCPGIRLLQHDRNRGYGAALRTGFAVASLELVAFTDADCQFDLLDLRHMLPLTNQHDIVCGSRINRQDPALRLFCSWGFNSLIKLLLGSPVHDVDCALKVFHRDSLCGLLPESAGFFANAEMLSLASSSGLSIGEMGVCHRPRAAGKSKVSLSAVPRTLAALLPFWWTRHQCPAAVPTVNRAPLWYFAAMAIVALVSGVQLFADLDYPLFEPDEGRYAEIGREMLVNHEWIVPTLHQEPYLDKPPLFYWLLALSYRCFGVHDWAARLVPAGAAWISILATGLLGRRIAGNVPSLLAATALSLALGFMFAGRFLVLDSVLSLFIGLSMFCAYEAVRGERVGWAWWLCSSAFCGLAILTKGPVAVVLTLPPLAAHGWLSGQTRKLSLWHWLAYLAVAGALVVPWFAMVLAANSNFTDHFFWDHHVARFLSGLNHPEPFWYYAPVLLLGGMPWTVLLLPWLYYLFSSHRDVAATRSPAHGFFLLWAAWCLFFFSLSSCKLPPYILPAAPALALLLGLFVEQLAVGQGLADRFPRLQRWAPLAATGSLGTALFVLVWIAWWAGLEAWQAATSTSVLCAVLLALSAWGRKRISQPLRWGLACGMALLFLYQSAHDLMPGLAQSRSPVPTTGEIADAFRDQRNGLIVYGRDCGSIPFYLGRGPVPRFDDTSTGILAKLLLQRPRTLLVTRAGTEVSELRTVIPADTHLTCLGQVGRKSVWLLDSQEVTRSPSPRTQMH